MASDGVDADGTIIVPRTLDEARRLVEPPEEEDEDEDEEDTSLSAASPLAAQPNGQVSANIKSSDNLLNTTVGRKQSRDRSVDSVQSSGSGKRVVAFASDNGNLLTRAGSPSSAPAASNELLHTGNVAVESMRSLGNTLNSLKGFGGMSVMRGFGRSTSSGTPTPTLSTAGKSSQELQQAPAVGKVGTDAQNLSIKALPPIQRLMDVASAEDLKIGEVAELLDDYKRLAGALKSMGAF